jgi:hypothetical protein
MTLQPILLKNFIIYEENLIIFLSVYVQSSQVDRGVMISLPMEPKEPRPVIQVVKRAKISHPKWSEESKLATSAPVGSQKR